MRESHPYDPQAVEAKWMFPYPSAEGLHVGNVFAFTGADIHGRFRRLRGDLVFEHFAEECWERLGHRTRVMDATWPAFDAAVALDQQVEIIVQVNGKVRGRIAVPRGTGEAAAVAAAKAEGAVGTAILGKEVRKVVFVPDRVVNLVVA